MIEEPMTGAELEAAQRRLVGRWFQLCENVAGRGFATGRTQFLATDTTGDLASWAPACFVVTPAESPAARFAGRQIVCDA
ncbi:MAG TPA: hypothetical protein VGX49_16445 [Jatrophihabitans sp.]|nr:hypothetical protein [Jatrophihabitans sp.]